jgi:diamine N-acetyltransferase
MPQVTLKEITKDNWRQVYKLKLDEPQRNYVAPNGYSMLEAVFNAEYLLSRAAYDGETLVGYTLYGVDPDNPRDHWISRLMVVQEHQGKGYGRAIMREIIEALKAMSGCEQIFISFVPENTTARKLYESLGFVDTGRMDDGEMIFRMPVEQQVNGG